MRRFWRQWLSLAAVVLWLPMVGLTMPERPGAAPAPTDGYQLRIFHAADGQSMHYFLHVPAMSPVGVQHFPLVLLLHGGGERGHHDWSDAQNRAILADHPYVQQWVTPSVQSTWPAFIVVPQAMDDQRWVAVDSAQGSYQLALRPTDLLLMVSNMLTQVQAAYPEVDAHRMYITGISMGGYGVWDAIERWPERFAAAAPLSGGGDPSRAASLSGIPIWAFHGQFDGDPPPSASRAMVAAVRAAGGQVRYTEYPQAGHDIWLQVYTSQEFLAWLFAQVRATTFSPLHDVGQYGPLLIVTLILAWLYIQWRTRYKNDIQVG